MQIRKIIFLLGCFVVTMAGCTNTDTGADATAHTHGYISFVTKPTCTETGYTTYTCSCGYTYTAEKVEALGHSYEKEVTKESTCTESGEIIYRCFCGHYYSDSTEKKEHTYTGVVTEPTCTERGYTTYTCDVCGDSYIGHHEIAETGHSYVSEIIKEATCTKEGEAIYTCHCGHSYTGAVAKTSHSYKRTETEATCIEKGYATFTCSCGESYKEYKDGFADHKWNSWKVTQQGDCLTAETSRRTCSVCGKEDTKTVDPTGQHSYAENGTCSGCGKKTSAGLAYQLEYDGKSYTLIGIGSCKDTEIIIPEVYNGLPVKKISENAFKNRYKITKIVIPASVDSITVTTFDGCSNLAEIVVENGSQYYKSVDGILYSCYSYEGDAIMMCPLKKAGNIKVAEGVTTIKGSAFSGCELITGVELSNGVTSIGYSAFDGCVNLAYIEMPETINEIGSCAFKNCTKLSSIVMPDNIVEIGSSAFEGCVSLESIVIPEGVATIEGSAFMGCTSLESIVIPEGVATIGYRAFEGCVSLKSIVIPEGVATIEGSAFMGCTSLESIVIPEGVTAIGSSAFSGCTGLESIVIPEGVTAIGNNAFSGCTGLEGIVIPEGVTTIERSAFSGCTGLESIVIPEGVTAIGNNAFSGCTSLESMVIPEGVATIERSAFNGCTSLENVTLPKSIMQIEMWAFTGCPIKYIDFEGTKEQWKAIEKGTPWKRPSEIIDVSTMSRIPVTITVRCTDGELVE